MSRNSSWGYRVDSPSPIGHYWQWVTVGKVVKVESVCGAMKPVNELQVSWAEGVVQRPCVVCMEVSGITPTVN